jgi:hypothetical protein
LKKGACCLRNEFIFLMNIQQVAPLELKQNAPSADIDRSPRWGFDYLKKEGCRL